jgi:hypothetical protein
MSKDLPAVLRTVGLWVMLAGVSVADAVLYWQAISAPAPINYFIYVWAIFWSCIIALVVGFEIYGKFFSGKDLTISNMYRDWQKWEKAGNRFQWSRTCLAILWVAFTGLIVHLWFYGGM